LSDQELTCVLAIEVNASRPGTVSLSQDTVGGFTQLQPLAGTDLYGTKVRLEVIKRDENHVLLIQQIGGSTSRKELRGSYREIVDELRSSRSLSVKTERGTSIELCQIQGKPVSVLVEGALPASPSSHTRVFKSWVAMAVLLMSVSVLTLFIVLFVSLGRSSARRAIAWVAGVILLLFGVIIFA